MTHTLITGYGYSGTTFLMRLLSELGYNTWYKSDVETTDPKHGLEWLSGDVEDALRPSRMYMPTVLKDPKFLAEVYPRVEAGPKPKPGFLKRFRDELGIDMVYVCRRNVDEMQMAHPNNPYGDPDYCLGRGINLLEDLEIPYTVLSFPRMLKDPLWLYRALDPETCLIAWDVFQKAHAKVYNPDFDRSV